jgi:hypothetical protein
MDDEIEVIQEGAEQHWIVLEYRGNQAIRVNARALDRILADGPRLILDIGDYAVALDMESGPEAARLIVDQLQQYTRSAPIQDDISYNLAKQIIEAAASGQRGSLSEPVLLVGDTELVARGDTLYAGDLTCGLGEAYAAAEDGKTLGFANGSVVQAALAIIVFAHQFRVENVELLARRVAEYERQRREDGGF